jgi:Fe-S cluster biogenesis protein NfuA
MLSESEVKIRAILDRLQPFIIADGGGIELVKVQDRIVYVKMLGACVTCPASSFTQKMVLEKTLKEELPQDVTEVVLINS